MNNVSFAEDALQRIRSAAANRTGYELLISDKSNKQHKHEFLFFIKPEEARMQSGC